jgi:BolA protein
MDRNLLINRIQTELPDAKLHVEGEDCSFAVTVVSQAFEGVRLLSRQQTILRLFEQELAAGELHALSVVAKTPTEFRATLVNLA